MGPFRSAGHMREVQNNPQKKTDVEMSLSYLRALAMNARMEAEEMGNGDYREFLEKLARLIEGEVRIIEGALSEII